MKWIEMTEDAGTFTKGQRIQKEDAAADMLIELGKAKASTAPETPETSAAALTQLVEKTAQASATAAIAEMVKAMPTVKTAAFREVNEGGYELGSAKKFVVPATARKYSSLKHFEGEDADQRAYRFGMWCLANYALNGKIADPERQEKMNAAVRRCKSMGIPLVAPKGFDADFAVEKNMGAEVVQKASSESSNTSSAFLVPEDFETDIIDLREKFSVFRQNAKIVPMASDTRTDPRRRGGLQYYYVGEDAAGTQSTKSWDRVRLTAKKLMVLSKFSNELNEDAVINVGDDLMGEIAYAFAYAEDQAGFIGTGSSTYGGITGVCPSLKNLSGTISQILGLFVSTGTGYATNFNSIVLGDFNNVVGLLPEYADENNAKWYVSRAFWGGVMQRLQSAAGGNTIATLGGGAREKTFLGYPVVVAQAMPKTSAVSQVSALFGDLKKCASFGTRRGVTISISDVALNAFEQDEVAIRGTERFDIVVHDVGELTTDTGRDSIQGPLAGPVVGLITAAS